MGSSTDHAERIAAIYRSIRNTPPPRTGATTMSQRTTKKELNTAFDIFLRSIGGRRAANYDDIGGYILDQGYGGYCVAQIMNEHGGQTCPFGHLRRPAREMATTLHFAADVAHVAKGER